MKNIDFNTTHFLRKEDVKEIWCHIDATNLICGRLASKVVTLLKGKDSPLYTQHTLPGLRLVITNADKIVFTGKKLKQKFLYKHTQRLGGLQQYQLSYMMQRKPAFVLQDAIKCMFEKTRQRKEIMTHRLFIYAGDTHPHHAQNPKTITI